MHDTRRLIAILTALAGASVATSAAHAQGAPIDRAATPGDRGRSAFTAAGASALAIGWVAAVGISGVSLFGPVPPGPVLRGADLRAPMAAVGLAPVFGPFVSAALAAQQNGLVLDGAAMAAIYVATGVVQATGFALLVYGLTRPAPRVSRVSRERATSFVIVPSAAASSAGATMSVTF